MRKARLLQSIVLAGVLLCAGCLQLKEFYQQTVARSRRPGVEMVESPESTMRRYCCGKIFQDTLVLERVEALPENAFPGEEINNRVRYAVCCPGTRPTVLRGRLIRTVYYGGRVVFQDVTESSFCPGTWNADAFIRIPSTAPPGRYAIEVEVRFGKKSLRQVSSFVVKKGTKGVF